jgi:hypothetical protein
MNKEKDLAKEVKGGILFWNSIGDRLRSSYTSEFGYEVLLSKDCGGDVDSLMLFANVSDEPVYMGKVSALIKQDSELRVIVIISPVLLGAGDLVSKFFTTALSSVYGVSTSGSDEIELFPFSDVQFAHIVDTTHLGVLVTPSQLNELANELHSSHTNEQVSRYRLYLINGTSDESGIADCISEVGIA